MELELEIVSYHRLSPEQVSKKTFIGSATLGRAEKSDWYLPDPEKVVSGCHAKIENKNGIFYINDTSTNGLYINRNVEALGQENTHTLEVDDLLTFGDYEVKVIRIATSQTTNSKNNNDTKSTENQLISMPSVEPAIDFDQNLNQKTPKFDGQINDDFSVPNTSIPEEWDFGLIKDPNLQKNLTSHENSNPKPNDLSSDELNNEIKLTQQVHQPKAESHSNSQQDSPSNINQLLKSFLTGIGCKKEIEQDLTDEIMFELGESLNLLLVGVMQTLRQRAEIKNDFRINQTTFQQSENNPLKFSASIDDVVQNLFLRRSTSFLSAKSAIVEAFNDTQNHEKSLITGTQGAVEGILNQLDPDYIKQKDFNGQNVLEKIIPNQKPAKYWKLYSLIHADMKQGVVNQKSQIWHDDFVAAYDKKIKSLV